MPVPDVVKPMLARISRTPFDSEDFLYELKWDGIRAIVFVQDGEVRVQSRNLRNITSQFEELKSLPATLKAKQAVLDGELVVFDGRGRPSLSGIQSRLQANRVLSVRPRKTAEFVAFDLLYLEGATVMNRPLIERKQMLGEILPRTSTAQPCEYIANDGVAFYAATVEHGLEGIMAKDRGSTYVPGSRNPGWLKIKRMRESDFVVAGYEFGGRRELFSSLLLGLYEDDGSLRYVGSVGGGFRRSDIRRIHAGLEQIHRRTPAFHNEPAVQNFVYWCQPQLVCRVRYGEFTEQLRLRYPTYLATVDDKSPEDCTLADAPGWPAAELLL